MNITDYISSGILEAYVLGTTSPEESRQVEQLMAQYPEIRKEIEQIEEALNALAWHGSVSPPATAKEKLFARLGIDAVHQESTAPSLSTTSAAQPVISLSRIARFAVAASVLVALASAALSLFFWQKWQHAEQKLAIAMQQSQQLADHLQVTKFENQKLSADLSVTAHPDYRTVSLKGLAPAPGANAVVFWNPASQEVFLRIAQLPAPQAGKQYQLWAIVEGKPVDAGVFDAVAGQGLIKMKNIARASAFAVTLEPRGGSANPTLEAMYLMGKV